MSTSELYFSQDLAITQSQTQTQGFSSEVLDEHPWIEAAIVSHLEERIEGDAHSLKIVAFTGEPGIQKGTLLGQFGKRVDYRRNQMIVQAGAGYRSPLELHYLSSSGIIHAGIARGIQEGPYGTATPAEIVAATEAADKGLEVAEKAIPHEHPLAVNILLEEFAGVSETDNMGTDIITRQGKNPNTIVVFLASVPAVQEKAYRERRRLWTGAGNEAQILKANRTVLDIAPEKARETMGTHRSIERVSKVVNQEMYDAWENKEFYLPLEGPNKVPWDVLWEHDPRDLSGNQLEEFFRQLTIFTRRGMKTNPIRPYLQAGFYEYRAQMMGIEQYLVTIPREVTGKIHGYIQFLKDHEIPLGKYIDEAERLEQAGDIFVDASTV